MEEYNLRVFLMVTHSPVGALPLGIIITSDEKTSTLIQAFDLFKLCLSNDSFYGKGLKGPTIFMTDNCQELRDALAISWPLAVLLLCIFHILQQVWRWLFEKKHQVASADRPGILLKFKKVVYAESEEEFEEAYDELTNMDAVSQNSKLLDYFSNLQDIRDDWASFSRSDLRKRGSNTNNFIESQFLVIKDEVLNRTKEVNINGLLNKLTVELMDHYKIKLLNVSSGKFDGCYSRRFKGLGKGKEGLGLKIPQKDEMDRIKRNVQRIDEKIYSVPSFTNNLVMYTVDMNIGVCECPQGTDGSACKHQYLLWMTKMEKSSSFLPYFDPQERQKYAEIAIGSSLSSEFYEGLHDRVVYKEGPPQPSIPTVDFHMKEQNDDQPCSSRSSSGRRSIEVVTAEECKEELRKTVSILEEKLTNHYDDINFLRGVAKFCERVEKYPISRLSSALNNFGVQSATSVKITASSSLKKAKKGKIYVQPTAVQRRKVKNGSKNATIKGMNVRKGAFGVKEPSKKRPHCLTANVASNEAVPKKAGRHMCSKTRIFTRRKKKQKME